MKRCLKMADVCNCCLSHWPTAVSGTYSLVEKCTGIGHLCLPGIVMNPYAHKKVFILLDEFSFAGSVVADRAM